MENEKLKKRLEAIAASPDYKIDQPDIRPESKLISIRLNSFDLALATKLAIQKGLPYQTYIKSLLHESLVRENQKAFGD